MSVGFGGLPGMVIGALGSQMYIWAGAVNTVGPQKVATVPADPEDALWENITLVKGVFGFAGNGDVRNRQMRDGSEIPGPRREERTFSIEAAALSARPSPEDRLIEKTSGKNWMITNVTDRYDGDTVSYYVLSLRELKN